MRWRRRRIAKRRRRIAGRVAALARMTAEFVRGCIEDTPELRDFMYAQLGLPQELGPSPLRAAYPAWRMVDEVRRIRAMDEARYHDRRRDDEVWS